MTYRKPRYMIIINCVFVFLLFSFSFLFFFFFFFGFESTEDLVPRISVLAFNFPGLLVLLCFDNIFNDRFIRNDVIIYV